MYSKNWLNSAVLIGALNFNSQALAQDDTQVVIEDNVALYTSEDILAMQGQSALDIIEQIAGFQFIDSNDLRGLSSASGNVLVNGLPVLNKSQSLEAILADLHISQIAEMEVYLAGHPFSSVSQYTQAVNIIRDNSQNRANWQVGAQSHKDFNQVNAASLQVSTQWLDWDHQLQLSTDKNLTYSTTDYTESNHQNISYLNGQEQYQESIENISTGITSSKVMTDSVLQINTLFLKEHYQEDYDRDWQDNNDALGNEAIKDKSQLNEYELGFDWQQQANESESSWLWQVTGLLRLRDSGQVALTTEQNESELTLTQFEQTQSNTEQVLKLSTQQPTLWWQPELGIEVSHNRLEADTLEAHSSESNVTTTSVSETRAEPFIASKIELNPQWQLYSKLTGEYAKLSSQSNNRYETQSRYLKPLIKLSYQAKNGLQSTFTLQRRVDQLDFTDFLDSQDNDFGREQSGNTELKPQQSIEFSYELNYEADDHWTLNTRAFWQKQRDIHEFIRFDNGDWGVGNAGHAYYYGLDLDINIQTNWLLEDSLINVFYEYRDANYDDPLTGDRAISWLEPHSAEIEFRKGEDWYAWGVLASLPDTETGYYPEEVYRQKDRATYGFYAEFDLDSDMQINIELEDAFGGEYLYDRHIYQTDRTGMLDYRYYALEHSEPSLTISFSGEF
ncbi:hypothetical protein CWB72_13645 [Pseudoalteromonas phenolica]|uniref:TonB-dependent receptor plug domain-containing protein n=1 Tax=Pseudoalteromonas phenolica TaxID=161398 RepID=UPI00110B747E|nr:TonB-dependent receptor plug domain-containing protein [Pseudoalteromonas phenolica]TMN88159.1 hypothetical protein CWB72_13645 [Pseudoalteromonas phenolica]